jgi:osmoprotectant transport system ATP-binding protein
MRAGHLIAQGTAQELSNSTDDYVNELLNTPRRQAERLQELLPKDRA